MQREKQPHSFFFKARACALPDKVLPAQEVHHRFEVYGRAARVQMPGQKLRRTQRLGLRPGHNAGFLRGRYFQRRTATRTIWQGFKLRLKPGFSGVADGSEVKLHSRCDLGTRVARTQ